MLTQDQRVKPLMRYLYSHLKKPYREIDSCLTYKLVNHKSTYHDHYLGLAYIIQASTFYQSWKFQKAKQPYHSAEEISIIMFTIGSEK